MRYAGSGPIRVSSSTAPSAQSSEPAATRCAALGPREEAVGQEAVVGTISGPAATAKPGGQRGVAPHLLQPEDPDQEIGGEGDVEGHHRDHRPAEGSDPEQVAVDEGGGVPARRAARTRSPRARPGRTRRPVRPPGPAPLGALDQTEGQQSDGGGEESGADEVGSLGVRVGVGLGHMAQGREEECRADRQVDAEHPLPADLGEHAADRRAERGRDRSGRRPEPHPAGSPLGGRAVSRMPRLAGVIAAAPAACRARKADQHPDRPGRRRTARWRARTGPARRRTAACGRSGRPAAPTAPAARRTTTA